MKNIPLIFILFSLISCKTIMVNRMLRDPKVENTQTIKNFQTKNGYSTENSLIIKADTSSAIEYLFLGMSVGYYIFDKDGNQICYNGSSTCRGLQFKQMLEDRIDSFKSCKNETVSLDKILNQTYDLNERPATKEQFKKADYYVVSYWQKFLGGKRGYKEAISWMEDELKKNKSAFKFIFIKINTDLQESSGFVAGKKANLKLTVKDGSMTLDVLDLPTKR